MAATLVLEPIFEADLPPEQHTYRAEPSALDAVRQVHGPLSTGHTDVVDADLSGYFDSIPHSELMKSVARRVSARHLLKLIKTWLEAPVEESDARGRPPRTARKKNEGRGIPQGSPLAPLLAHRDRRRFVVGGKAVGHGTRCAAHLVNPAGDFARGCRATAAEAPRTGRPSRATPPSAPKLTGWKAEISAVTRRRGPGTTVADRVAQLNRRLLGGSTSFGLGPVSPADRAVDRHARHRLRQGL
jgi:RNA-directed DNA polymerase